MKNILRSFNFFSILVLLLFFNVSLFGQIETLPTKGICAHRGANKTHPENTIAAFKEAIRLGAQMIEFDVQLTKDNQLIVMHDASVDRTTNGTGLVKNLRLDQIRELDAGTWKSDKYKGEKVPTLTEVLQMMPSTIWLNIHLKGNKKLGSETARIVVAENRINQSVIACEKRASKGVLKINTSIKICNMERLSSRDQYIDETIVKGFPFLQIKSSRDNDKLLADVQRLKENGVRINYFYAEEESKVKELLDAGVDFILTNHLASMLDAFENYNTIEK